MAAATAKEVKPSGGRIVGTRITGELEARFSAYEARVEKKLPEGIHASGSDILRTIIEAGLDALERKK